MQTSQSTQWVVFSSFSTPQIVHSFFFCSSSSKPSPATSYVTIPGSFIAAQRYERRPIKTIGTPRATSHMPSAIGATKAKITTPTIKIKHQHAKKTIQCGPIVISGN